MTLVSCGDGFSGALRSVPSIGFLDVSVLRQTFLRGARLGTVCRGRRISTAMGLQRRGDLIASFDRTLTGKQT